MDLSWNDIPTTVIKPNFRLALLFVLIVISKTAFSSPYDGIWIGKATSSLSSCSGADVNIVVTGTQIKGTAIDLELLEVFNVTGNVSSSGNISNGAFATGDQGTVANFSGTFSSNTASGSWNTNDGCFGTFQLSLIASYDDGFNELWKGSLVSTSGGSDCGTGSITLTVYKTLSYPLRGHALSSYNEYYAIIGTINGNSFSGAAGTYSYTFGSYSGTFSGDTASGTWSDASGCSGTFQMSLSIRNPDTDNDGTIDSIDTDDDNDGVSDSNDAFPLDPTESVDTDGDGIGDNADTDDDNDGVSDVNDAFPLDASESVDTDNDGIGDNADTDDDNDGVSDSNDAFPLDASESADTDNDGIGNNADTDDDNDGMLDVEEIRYGFNPLYAGDASSDYDNDGLTNLEEIQQGRNPIVNESIIIQIILSD